MGLLAIFLNSRFIPRQALMGEYVNTNYDNEARILRTPYEPDTLILMSSNRFVSGYYGYGTYEVSYTVKGTNIHLYYYDFGQAGYHTYVRRAWFSSPRIILNWDMNHYYKKIK